MKQNALDRLKPMNAPEPRVAVEMPVVRASSSNATATRRIRTREYILLASTLFICFAVAEAFTTFLVPAPLPWHWPQVRYDSSESLGFRLTPNQVSYTADKPVRTNSMGLRGPEPRAKGAGVRRILILGDSIAFGFGMAQEDTFAQQLERLLNHDRPGSAEVINAGVPAYNTQQEVTYFQEAGILLKPDVAVLALYWNDVSSKAGVIADSQGRLVDDATPSNPGWYSRWSETRSGYWVRNLLKRSNFLYFVVDRVRQLRAGSARSTPAAMQLSVLNGTAHAAVTAGWEEIDRQLAILSDLCRVRGIELVVAVLPMPQLLGGEHRTAQYPREVMRMCREHRLHCVDVQPAFAREFTGHDSLFIPYDGDHPNERGHRIIAEQLYAMLFHKIKR